MRRRPTPRWRRTRFCCRKPPRPTTNRSWRSLPTTSSAAMAPPPARSTRRSFYLKARGIPPKEAEALLIQAFVGEAVEGIEHAGLREALIETVVAWLAARAARAEQAPRAARG